MHPADAKLGRNNLKLGWQILAHFGHIEPKRANLPTPMVSDAYNDNMVSTQHTDGTMHSVSLAQLMQREDLIPGITGITAAQSDLLPTPTTSSSQRNSRGTMLNETKAAGVQLEQAIEFAQGILPREFQSWDEAPDRFKPTLEKVTDLFPTPLSRDYKDGSAQRVRNGKIQTDSLALALFSSGEVEVSSIVEWGKFEPAIRRWEETVGRKAPSPTNPDGKQGRHRLSSKFTEWMMGLPDGWVTDVGLKRPEELKVCGNGVVPQQAYLALQILVGDKVGEIFGK